MFFRGQDRHMNPRGSHSNFRGRGGIQRGFNRGGMAGPRVAAPTQSQNRVNYPDNNFGNRGGGNFNRSNRGGPGPAPRFIVESAPPNTDRSRERERDFNMRSSVQMERRSISPTESRDYMAKSNRNISRPSGSGSRFSPERIDADAGRSRERTRETFRSSQDRRQSPQNISEKPVRKPPPAPRFIVGSSKNISDKSDKHNLERDFSPDSKGRRGNNLLDDNTFASPRPIEQNFNRPQEKRRDLAYRDQDVHRMESFHDNNERTFSSAAQRRNDNIADGHKVSSMPKFSPEQIRGGKFSSDRTSQHVADRGQRVRDDWENTDHRKSTINSRNTSVRDDRHTSPEFFIKPSNKNVINNSPRSSNLQRKTNISIERCFFDESGEEISAEQIIPGEDLQRGKVFHGRTSGPGKLAEHNISWADIARRIGFPDRNDDRQPLPESSRFSSRQIQGNSAGLPMTTADINIGRDRSNGRDFQRPNSNVRRRSLSPSDNIRSNMRFKGRNDDEPVVVPEPPVIGNISSQQESSSSRYASNDEGSRRGLRVIDIDLLRNVNRDRSRSPIRSSHGSDFLVESSKNIKRTLPRNISPDLTKRRRDTTFGMRKPISSRRFSVDSIRPDSPVRHFSPDPPRRVENVFVNRNSGRDLFADAKRESAKNFERFNLAPKLPSTTYTSPQIHENFDNIDNHNEHLSIPSRLTERNVETFDQFNSVTTVFPDMSQGNENNFGKSKRAVYRSKGYTNEDRERVMGELNRPKQFMNPNNSNIDIFAGNPGEVFNKPVPVPVSARENPATRNISFGNLITVIPNAKINFKNRVNNPIADRKVEDFGRNISNNNKSTNPNLRTAENISFFDIPPEENEIPFDIPSFASKFYPKRNLKPNPEFSGNRAFEESKIPLKFSQNREIQQRDQKISSVRFSPERAKKPNPDYFGIGNFDESLTLTKRFSSNREREQSPSPRRNQDFNDYKAPPKVFAKVENPIDKINDNDEIQRKRLSGAQRRKHYKEKLRRSTEPENITEVEPDVLDETDKEILAAKERVMRLDQNYNKLLNKIKESGHERNVSPKRRSRSTSRERYTKEHLRGTKMEKRTSLSHLDEKEDLRDFITSLSTSKERYAKEHLRVNKMERRISSSLIDENPDLRDLKIDILNRNHPVGKMTLFEKHTLDERLDHEIGLARKYGNLFIPEFTKSDLIGGIFRINAINNKSVEWLKKNIYKFKNIWPNADPTVIDKMSTKDYQKISIEVTGYEVSFLEDICRRLMRENPTIHTGLWIRLEKYTTGPTEKIVLLVDPESIVDIEKLGRELKYENKFIHVIIYDEYLQSKKQYDDHALRGEYPLESRSRYYL